MQADQNTSRSANEDCRTVKQQFTGNATGSASFELTPEKLVYGGAALRSP